MINLNKMGKEANKKVKQLIDKLADQAHADTIKDFAETRTRLEITDEMDKVARKELATK
jgi:hypothetical protein